MSSCCITPGCSTGRSWESPVDQKQLAPKTMQLAVVLTEESRVICRDLVCASRRLVAGCASAGCGQGHGAAVDQCHRHSHAAMANPAPTIETDLEAVTAALAGVEPRPGRVLLFGSRARGDGRPDSDIDLLVVMPQATLTPQERQQALRSLRAALRPLPLSVGVDLVVVGEEDARRLAGSRWHVVARALREGKELHVAG
jgi:uncharacterized protein